MTGQETEQPPESMVYADAVALDREVFARVAQTHPGWSELSVFCSESCRRWTALLRSWRERLANTYAVSARRSSAVPSRAVGMRSNRERIASGERAAA